MHVSYAYLLSQHILRSELTLRQIARQCKELGHSIDPSYISKLQTGHLPPPSQEVSQMLAKVLNADADELIFWGYIEKAPTVIKQRLLNQDVPAEIFSCAKRLFKLSPPFRLKLLNELQWLEELEKAL